MAYAVKHDYPDTISIIAPLFLDKPLEDALVGLPLKIALAWVTCSFSPFDYYTNVVFIIRKARYQGRWFDCNRFAISRCQSAFQGHGYSRTTQKGSKKSYLTCTDCSSSLHHMVNTIIIDLAKGIAPLKNMDNTADPKLACCDKTKRILAAWRAEVEDKIKQIPAFDTFL